MRTRMGIAAVAVALVAAACGAGEPLAYDDAVAELDDLLEDVDWAVESGGRDTVTDVTDDLAQTLPPISEYDMAVTVPFRSDEVVVEIFSSTEKSGSGTDGWIVEVAEEFNDEDVRLADGRPARVQVREIASGVGYQFLAAGEYLPHAFTPSNHLWVEMAAARGVEMTPVSERLVSNVAGIVMESETADLVRERFGAIDAETLIEAVVNGDVVMGYTDPFASSTGLNFLVTVLLSFADGDETRMLDDDVVSAFERFQANVPFVALTTLQMREAVENERGSLDAFVMEYQTFVNADLENDFEFIPFGIAHDNPLYAVGTLAAEEREVLDLFAAFAENDRSQDTARDFGFDPPQYTSPFPVPSGERLIRAQQLWKEKKDAGRPVAAVFVADVSGSMAGTRIAALKRALTSGAGFITEENSVGMVVFNDEVTVVLPIDEFDLNQQGAFNYAVRTMDAFGGTAMYDGVLVGLRLLLDETAVNPDVKPLLFVLTDGETTDGYTFGDVDRLIEGLRIPVYTVGFEANIQELSRLSSLVEAANLNAGEGDVEFRIGSLFNAEL